MPCAAGSLEAFLSTRAPLFSLQRVPGILRTVIKEEGLGELPLFTLGGSSGGSFALRVAAAMPEVQVR
jgi:alpha-beta hydrolase superfamily lysophospholipase